MAQPSFRATATTFSNGSTGGSLNYPTGGGKSQKCCCQAPTQTCIVAQDDFDRPNNADPGSKWVEVSGSAEIVDNQLNIDTAGVIVTSARQPTPKTGLGYNLRINLELIYEVGRTYGIICGFEDENNFDWIRFTAPANQEDPVYPEFLRRTGGSDSVLMDITTHPQSGAFFFINEGVDSIMRISICYAQVEWTVFQLNGPSENFWSAEEGPSTPTCGGGGKSSLPTDPAHGLVGFTDGRYDNWVYEIHWESDPACSNCSCFCQISITDYLCLEEELTFSMYPVQTYCWDDPTFGSGCCDPGNVISETLYQKVPTVTGFGGPGFPDPTKKTASKRFWYTNILLGESGNNVPDDFWVTLICDLTRDRIILAIAPWPVLPNTLGYFPGGGSGRFDPPSTDNTGYHSESAYFIVEQSMCSPLKLVFPNIIFPRSAPSCGQCATCGSVDQGYGVNGLIYRPEVTI